MKFYIITLFPESFSSILSSSIIGRARKLGKIKINFVNPRGFTTDKYKTADDKPYGGGAGMVMKIEPIVIALESLPGKPYKILLSASGKTYTQKTAQKLLAIGIAKQAKSAVAIICGHYEGVDARVEKFVDEVISIGDYVLTGGEIAAMAIVDSVTRLIPGVIESESLKTESFSKIPNYLEYPQYTRPEEFRGLKVPKVLLSGNHEEIKKWHKQESIKRTRRYKPKFIKNNQN